MRLLLPVALLVLASGAAAQVGSVRGTVTDGQSLAPLQGATIRLLPTPDAPGDDAPEAPFLGAATNADGEFELRRVPAGDYALRVSFVGYLPVERPLAVRADETTEARVVLAPDTTGLSGVSVTAAREGGAAALTAGLQTVTPADLALAPVPGVGGDLASYLQTLPAVTATGDRGGQLYIRGGEPSQTLTRVNGLRVGRPFHVLGFYSAVPTEVVDEADVWAGAFPARHGGRLSAVLDVRARGGSKERIAASGALAPALSAAHVEGPLVPGRVSALVSVRESLLERVLPTWLGQRLPYRFGDALATVDARVTDALTLEATGLRSHDEGQIAGTFQSYLGDAVPGDAESDSLDVRWRDEAAGGRALWAPRALPVSVTLGAHAHRATSGFGPEDAPTDPTAFDARRTSRVEGWEASGEAVASLGAFGLRLGAMRYDATVAYTLTDRFVGLSADTSGYAETAVWTEAEWASGGLRVLGGLRAERFEPQNDWALAPSVRASWTPEAGVLREVSAAVGVAHQGLVGVQDSRDVGDVFTAFVPVGAGEALPRADHLVVGTRWAVPTGGGGFARIAAEGYVKRFSELLIPRLDPFPGFTAALERGSGDALGADLRLDLAQPLTPEARLTLGVGVGLSRVTYETARGSFSPPHDRPATFHAAARVDWGRWALSAVVQASDGLPYTPSAGFEQWIPIRTPDLDVETAPGRTRVLYGARGSRRLPTYLRADLWVARSLTEGRVSTTLQAGVVNATNRANPFYFDLLTLRRADQLPVFPSIGLKVEVR